MNSSHAESGSGGTRRRSPYQGLIPYDEEDAPFFFGRDKDTRLISANLFAAPLTLLYGASGVGKSSVLRAGVAYHLRPRDDLLVVAFSTWQGDTATELKAAVAAATRGLGATTIPSPASVPLADYLQACTAQLNRRLMIILDQFEEYFLYHPQDDAFATEFPQAVTRADLPVSFLISIREDSLARLDRFEGRIPTLFDNYLRLEHLDRHAAADAILKPVEQYNRLVAQPGNEVRVEPALVDAVIEQVKTGQVLIGQVGHGQVTTAESKVAVETPYLQLVLTRLWEEETRAGSRVLRLQTLNRLGGAERIIKTHLDAVMRGLSASEQDTAARVFHHLVTPSGTKIAHTAPDLAEYAKLPPARLAPVLDKLSGAAMRILRPVAPSPQQPTATRYEIFHDVLAPAVLDWRARYLRRARARKWQTVATILGIIALLVIGGLALSAQLSAQQARIATQKLNTVNEQLAQAQERVDLAQQELGFVNEQLVRAKQELAEADERLEQAQKELSWLQGELERSRKEVADLQQRSAELEKTLDDLRRTVQEAGMVKEFASPERLLADKYLATLHPQQSELLITMLKMRYAGVGWKLGGLSPEVGFDSPSFAAYVLEQQGLLPVPASAARYRLREILPAREQPRVGDVVFYELGYTMFYFVDEQRRPFVVGMTPLGILSLEKDFARILGYGEVKYP